jgi:hypothetical protein
MNTIFDTHLDPFGDPARSPAVFEKLHVPIDLHRGEHEKEFERLSAQRQVIEEQVTKYPLLGQALKEGWASIRLRGGELGFHFNSQRAMPAGEAAAEKIGNHFSVDDHQKRHSLAKADVAIDGADLRDSSGL